MSEATPSYTPKSKQGLLRVLTSQSWIGALAAVFALWGLAGYVTGSLTLSFLLANATIAGFLALAGAAQMTVVASGPGNFDLSLPYIVTFSAYIVSGGVLGQDHILASLLLTLATGAIAGSVNALLIVRLRIPSIVATLATGYILYSFIVTIQNRGFGRVGGLLEELLRARVAEVSGALVAAVLTLTLLAIILGRTVFGLQLHAMGQNGEAARLAGVRHGLLVLKTFVLSGVLAAWLGVLLAVYQGGVSADMGRTYLLGSVAAVVLGGTRISGGITSVIGTALGAMVLTLTQSDLVLMKFSIGVQYVIQGLIVLGTVCLVAARPTTGRLTQ